MGNVSSFTQCIIIPRKKTIKDDIQRLVDINIEFLNSLDDDDTASSDVTAGNDDVIE